MGPIRHCRDRLIKRGDQRDVFSLIKKGRLNRVGEWSKQKLNARNQDRYRNRVKSVTGGNPVDTSHIYDEQASIGNFSKKNTSDINPNQNHLG